MPAPSAPASSLGLAQGCYLPEAVPGDWDKAFPSWHEELLGSCHFKETFCSCALRTYVWDSAPCPEQGFAQLQRSEDWALLQKAQTGVLKGFYLPMEIVLWTTSLPSLLETTNLPVCA